MFKVELVKRSSAGARVMKIIWDNKTVLTMQRAVTSTEFNYNSALRSANGTKRRYWKINQES